MTFVSFFAFGLRPNMSKADVKEHREKLLAAFIASASKG